MSGINRNKGQGRKSRLNKTGSSEFIGFGAFQNKQSFITEKTQTNLTETTISKTKSAPRFSPSPVLSLGLNSADSSNATELITLFKKVGRKRDSTTRSKALADLCSLAFTTSSPKESKEAVLTKPEIIATLSHLVFLFYTKLDHDNDRTVRAQVLRCLCEAKRAVPKAWHTLMQHACNNDTIDGLENKDTSENISPSVLGIIWCLQCDPAPEVAKEARACLDNLFDHQRIDENPGSKMKPQTPNMVKSGILAYILSTMKHTRPSSLAEVYSSSKLRNQSLTYHHAENKIKKGKDNKKSSATIMSEDDLKEGEERFERVISSTIKGLQLFISNFIDCPIQSDVESPLLSILLSNRKLLWKHISSSRSLFRRESYRLISTFAQPQYDTKQESLTVAAPITILHETINSEAHIYTSLSTESDPTNLPFLVEAVLLFLSTFKEVTAEGKTTRWSVCDSHLICKYFSKLLKKACYGASAESWAPSILLLIHLLPYSIENEDGLSLPYELLSSMWEGKDSTTIRRHDEMAIVTAVAECSAFLLSRKFTPIEDEFDISVKLKDRIHRLCDFFNSSLHYYLNISTKNPKRMSAVSSTEQKLLDCLGRDLCKFDIMCDQPSEKSNKIPLLFFAKEYMFGTSKSKSEADCESNATVAYKKGIVLSQISIDSITTQTVMKLNDLLQNIGNAMTREKGNMKDPLSSSLLISSIRTVVEIIISKSRMHSSNDHDIELLFTMIKLFGVQQILPSTLPSANVYWSEDTNSAQTTATASTIEYFCMNDLLKLIIVNGHAHNNDKKDNIIEALFRMLQYCLEAIQSPLHQKNLWEAFLKEIIVAQCSLSTLSSGLSILSNEKTVDILRCKVFEDFVIEVGTNITTFSREKSKNVENDEKVDDDYPVLYYSNQGEISYFLSTCVGFTKNSFSLIGKRVLSKWLEAACQHKPYGSMKKVPKFHQTESNALLNTLILMAKKSVFGSTLTSPSIERKDIFHIIMESWYQNIKKWDDIVLPLLIEDKNGRSSALSLEIRDEVMSRCSVILKQELLEPTFSEEYFENNSHNWATRAWRLIKLASIALPNQSDFDHLSMVGLFDGNLWGSNSCLNCDWQFWCLYRVLSHFDSEYRRSIFLGHDRNSDPAKALVEILLSFARQSKHPPMAEIYPEKDLLLQRGHLLLHSIFGHNMHESTQLDDLLEACCYIVIEKVSDVLLRISEGKEKIASYILVLDILTLKLFNNFTIVESTKQDEIRDSSDLKVGEIVWYERKIASEDTTNLAENKLIKAKILKIHTDDFPNLYFTIEVHDEDGLSERQTVATRLKKWNENRNTVTLTQSQSVPRTEAKQSKALKCEQAIYDKIVKKILGSIGMQHKSKHSDLGIASKCINIIISRCGLQGAVGLGSLRYEIFQLVASFDRNISAKLMIGIDEDLISSLELLSSAMIGNPKTRSFNFDVLRLSNITSLQAICSFYEVDDNLSIVPQEVALKFHTSVIFWISVASYTITDFSLLSRISNVLNKATHSVMQQNRGSEDDLLFNSLSIMKAIEGIIGKSKVITPVSENSPRSLTFSCTQELVYSFVNIFSEVEERDNFLNKHEEHSEPVWIRPFSSLLTCPHDELIYDFKIAAHKFANELSESLFYPKKRFFGFHLLRLVATNTSKDTFDNELTLSSSTEKIIDTSSKNMTEEEVSELKEDCMITSKWLPRNFMSQIEKWDDSESFEEINEDLILGQLLTWLLTLDFLERAGNFDSRNRAAFNSYIQIVGVVNVILERALVVASLHDKPSEDFILQETPIHLSSYDEEEIFSKIANLVIFRTAQILPTLTKSWWNDYCPRSDQPHIKEFVQKYVASEILRRELVRIDKAENLGEMNVNGSCVSREVVATYVQDECELSVMIRIPQAFPLRNVEVDCQRTKGIAENRWRRWSLQIMRMLNSQDGTVLDALLLWKENVDKEFEGVEPCPICYSVLCVKTHAMPNLQCNTCKNRFHSTCLYKWFHSSGKSQCPLCQQPWSGTKI